MAGAMVISEWHAANQPNAQGEYIAIRGRAPGLMSWVFSLLGVERGVRMVTTGHHFKFQEGDLGGSSTRIIHLDNVCSTYYGYKKPWAEAGAMILPLAGLFGSLLSAMLESEAGFLLGIILAVVCGAIYYALNKQMTIGLVEHSGVVNEIVFKRSVLEGIDLDEQASAQASDIIQWLMDSARTGSGSVPTSSTQQGHI